MLEDIVYFFEPLVYFLGGIVFLTVLFSFFREDDFLLRQSFEELDDELKVKASLLAKKEGIYLKELMREFFQELSYRGKRYLSDRDDLNAEFSHFLSQKELIKEQIQIDYDPELHIKLFYIKIELEKLQSLSIFSAFKKKRTVKKLISKLNELLKRPHDKAYDILSQILFFLEKGNFKKAYQLLNNLYQLALKTFPEGDNKIEENKGLSQEEKEEEKKDVEIQSEVVKENTNESKEVTDKMDSENGADGKVEENEKDTNLKTKNKPSKKSKKKKKKKKKGKK